MNGYLSLLPKTFQWIAERLSSLSGLPWPLWIGGLFPLYAAAVSVMLWVLRGNTWPVRCLYPFTSRHRPCEHWVPGEWYRCRHHNWRANYKYGHKVDPTIKRWQRADKKGNLAERPSIGSIGMGVFRVRPAGHALLYENGYARKPMDVIKLVPEFAARIRRRLSGIRFREVSSEFSVVTETHAGFIEIKDDVAQGSLSVVQATQFATAAFFCALLATLISVFLHGAPRSAAQWVATLGFVLAWAAVSAGVYQKREDWLSGTLTKNLKWWALFFVPVAILNLIFMVADTP